MNDSRRSAPPEPWSHNIHYHRLILATVPRNCQRALDIGCGQGLLTRKLRQVVPQVTGIDHDQRSIEIARAYSEAAGIGYILGDFLDTPFQPESQDLVTSVASLHHMEAGAALRTMSGLLRPGGVLVVIGLARGLTLTDLFRLVPAIAGTRVHTAAWAATSRRSIPGQPASGYKSPIVWPPPLTYGGYRRLAVRALPGAQYRRRLYWRYSLIWRKPS